MLTADTSFMFSFYGADVNTAAAKARLQERAAALVLSDRASLRVRKRASFGGLPGIAGSAGGRAAARGFRRGHCRRPRVTDIFINDTMEGHNGGNADSRRLHF